MVLLLAAMILLAFLGVWLLNRPFDPANKILPQIYFSDSWHWEPAGDLKPRPECWGGLLLALAGAVGYVTLIRRDRLAGRLALAGCVAGGIGFPVGQSVQSWRVWHPQRFSTEALGELAPYLQHVNWWNMMEITFGTVFGLVLGVGLWLNRRLIVDERATDEAPTVTIPLLWEVRLCALHVSLLVGSAFLKVPGLAWYEASGLFLCAVPLVGVVAGRLWPYLMALPIALLPIAGKTLRNLSYEHSQWAPLIGWIVLVVVPLTLALEVALGLALRPKPKTPDRRDDRRPLGSGDRHGAVHGAQFRFFPPPLAVGGMDRANPVRDPADDLRRRAAAGGDAVGAASRAPPARQGACSGPVIRALPTSLPAGKPRQTGYNRGRLPSWCQPLPVSGNRDDRDPLPSPPPARRLDVCAAAGGAGLGV